MAEYIGEGYAGPINTLNQIIQQPSNLKLIYEEYGYISFRPRDNTFPAVVQVQDVDNITDMRSIVFNDNLGISIDASGEGGIDTGVKAADTGYDVYIILSQTQQFISAMMVVHGNVPTMPAGYKYISAPLRYVCLNIDDGESNFWNILPFQDMGSGLCLYHGCQDSLTIMSDDTTTAREAIPWVTHAIARKAQCPTTAIGAKIFVVAENDDQGDGDFGLYKNSTCTSPIYEEIDIGNGVQAKTIRRTFNVDWPIADATPDTALYKEWMDAPGDPKVSAYFLGYWLPYF